MRHRFILSLLPLCVAVAGCAETPRDTARVAEKKAADEIEIARILKGYTPGAPESCLPQQSGQYHTQGIGDTLLYSRSSDLIYRNDTTGCSGVARGDILVTVNYATRLCRGQIADTFNTTSRTYTGSCALGDFIPYRKDR